MPKIGVYGICKNEEEFLNRCLDSVWEADVISFCDTGSTDNTLTVLNEFAEHHGNVIVTQIHVNPWRFDDARNAALYSLPSDCDICISIDADEMLEVGWYKKLSVKIEEDIKLNGKTSDRYNHRFKTVWDWRENGKNISEHWHERIHARHNFMWKLPVHEHLVKCDGTAESIGWLPDVLMIQKPENTKSRVYLPMLEQSAKEDPKRWKTFSFLAGEYINAGDFDKADEALDHAILLPDSDKAFLHYQKSNLYQRKGDFDWAVIEMMNSCKSVPHIREYRVYLAQVYLAAGRKSDAIAALDQAAKITERTYGYEYNPSCWGEVFETFKDSIK